MPLDGGEAAAAATAALPGFATKAAAWGGGVLSEGVVRPENDLTAAGGYSMVACHGSVIGNISQNRQNPISCPPFMIHSKESDLPSSNQPAATHWLAPAGALHRPLTVPEHTCLLPLPLPPLHSPLIYPYALSHPALSPLSHLPCHSKKSADCRKCLPVGFSDEHFGRDLGQWHLELKGEVTWGGRRGSKGISMGVQIKTRSSVATSRYFLPST